MIPERLQKYQIKPEIFAIAMTHRSFINENPNIESNERLEFLGDAILEFLISQKLYQKFPDQPEGILTSLRSRLVRTQSLAQIATQLHLQDYLKMAKGEIATGGNQNPSLLENALEALIGAIYLSSGIEFTEQFLQDHVYPRIDDISLTNLKDPKSNFQEQVQSQGLPTPIYEVVTSHGPDHDKTFTSQVRVGEQIWGKGTGRSKQAAEQSAAEEAINNFLNTNP